jgi:integrase
MKQQRAHVPGLGPAQENTGCEFRLFSLVSMSFLFACRQHVASMGLTQRGETHMAVRQRKWTTEAGEDREAWIVDYRDRDRKRHIETFERKKDADARQAEIKTDIMSGTHVASSRSITVEQAAKEWLSDCDLNRKLERSTLGQYDLHVRMHIVPFIGNTRLAELMKQTVGDFEARLLSKGRNPATVRKVLSSLCSVVAYAERRGKIRQNTVRGYVSTGNGKRGRKKLKVGVDIPTPAEMKRILDTAPERYQTLLLVTALTGMRASEVRGLRWQDIDFSAKLIHLTQRVDRFGVSGEPKSGAGTRDIPLAAPAVQALKEWKIRPGDREGLVFHAKSGRDWKLIDIVTHGLRVACVNAGVVTEKGEAKYTGLHSLRHFYASWSINRVEDGGCGLPAKLVQERLGHSNIGMTLNVYGHLFPAGDDGGVLDRAAEALLG